MSRLSLGFAAIAAAMSTAACSYQRASDSGPPASQRFAVGNFSKLNVSGAYDVEVRTGPTPSVTATGPRNILDHMNVDIVDGTLRIRPDRKFVNIRWHGTDKVKVQVTVPSLEGAAIGGSGNIRVAEAVGPRFEGSVAGSGTLDVGRVDVQDLELSIAGSGDVRAAGRARAAEYSIAGSGDIDGSALETSALTTTIAGSGDVRARATGQATVKIAGSGDVAISGGAKCTVEKAGSGKVTCS